MKKETNPLAMENNRQSESLMHKDRFLNATAKKNGK